MKFVAVSQRVDVFNDRSETRDGLDNRLITLMSECGYLPFPIPNVLNLNIVEWLISLKPSALVLSGGGNIGENRKRDGTEINLLKYAQREKIPVLGICRGMQMMANFSGVTLKSVDGHVKVRHEITGVISGEVNSYHSYSLDTCPPDYDELARSNDGEIEAIRHKKLQWEGWMWHPERENEFALRDMTRIKNLFE